MKKVIMAEDLKASLERDRSFFDRAGIRSIGAATNDEILGLHRTEKADLIITNLDMPGMSGEDLCSLIRTDDSLRSVSIIIVCSETPENLQRCAHCGANAFVASPVNTAVLLQEAHQLLHVTQRKTCRVPLKVRLEGKATEKPFTGSIENISTAGLLFHTEADLFEGDAILCSFEIPDARRINLSAEVVRQVETPENPSRKKLYGARFTDIGDADASDIESFINTKTAPHLSRC
jgi:two-component system, chemotaxis family, chemotaxis protein CheY